MSQLQRTAVVELTTESLHQELGRILVTRDLAQARVRLQQLWSAIDQGSLELDDELVNALERAKDALGL